MLKMIAFRESSIVSSIAITSLIVVMFFGTLEEVDSFSIRSIEQQQRISASSLLPSIQSISHSYSNSHPTTRIHGTTATFKFIDDNNNVGLSSSSSSSAVKIDTTVTDHDKPQSYVIDVTDSNYRELFNGDKPLLLDTYARWCGPCKLMEPVLEECAMMWAKDNSNTNIVVGKFDVDDPKNVCRDLKIELILKGVMPKALPSLILIHKNQVLDTRKGLMNPTQLQNMLKKHNIFDENDGIGDKKLSRRIVIKDGNYDSPPNTFAINKDDNIVCENGVCRRRPSLKTSSNKSIELQKKNKSEDGILPRPFRGIGLAHEF